MANFPTKRTCSRTNSRYAILHPPAPPPPRSPITLPLTPAPQERKYFDSGDYALSKAGKASDIGVTQIGREHPVPEKIPHIAPPAANGALQSPGGVGIGADKSLHGAAGHSPVKEHTFLHRETSLNRETSAEDFEREGEEEEEKEGERQA